MISSSVIGRRGRFVVFFFPPLSLTYILQIPISVKPLRPASLSFTHLNYDFLGLLPTVESLAFRGRRLHETAIQRQSVLHAPDIFLTVDVEAANHKLIVNFVDDGRLVLYQGEWKEIKLWIVNAGTTNIDEMWMVAGPEDELLVDDSDCIESQGTLVHPLGYHIFNSVFIPSRPLEARGFSFQ